MKTANHPYRALIPFGALMAAWVLFLVLMLNLPSLLAPRPAPQYFGPPIDSDHPETIA